MFQADMLSVCSVEAKLYMYFATLSLYVSSVQFVLLQCVDKMCLLLLM